MKCPDVSMSGIASVRWFSYENPWMDVVVLVKQEDKAITKALVSKAIDRYWRGEFECYGDAIEHVLQRNCIRYFIIYHDSEDESVEYEHEWEDMCSMIEGCLDQDEV